MKKIMEVLLDDDGSVTFRSECNYSFFGGDLITPTKPSKKLDKTFKKVIEGFVKCIWEEGNTQISSVVRILSMAEMMACAQPYSQVEEFWSNMMFSFVPRMEKYSANLKTKYGFKDEDVVRPLSFGNPIIGGSIMPMPDPCFEDAPFLDPMMFRSPDSKIS